MAEVPAETPPVGYTPGEPSTLLSESTYKRLLPIVQVVLPALSVFYLAVAPWWDLPKQEEVSGTLMALAALLGTCMGISNRQYQTSNARFDGAVSISPHPDDPENASALRVQLDPEALADKDQVLVKVNRLPNVA